MTFYVDRHQLRSDDPTARLQLMASPNCSGQLVEPAFVILHYTAGTSFQSACKWLTSERSKASAHLVIGRAGEVAQLVQFDVRAWHAGKSAWGVEKHSDKPPTPRYTNLNRHSIGIELVNAGPLNKHADGSWRTLQSNTAIPDGDTVTAMHRNTKAPWHGWHAYTPAQIETLLEVGFALLKKYPSIKHVLGHDDIAWGRKFDPGPAFPMHSIATQLLGRADEE